MQGVPSLRELLTGIVSEDVAHFQERKYDSVPSQQIVRVTDACLLGLVNPYSPSPTTNEVLGKFLDQAVTSKSDSAITILGDTGSGKSFISTCLTEQFEISPEYRSLFSHAQTVIHALTCAKTLESERSSRCSTGYELFVKEGTNLLNYAQIKIHFLEVIRVTLNQLERSGERNFDIVYAVLLGRPDLFRQSHKELKYLQTKNSEFSDFVADPHIKTLFSKIDTSLQAFMPDTEEKDSVYKTIAGILLLGNVFNEDNSLKEIANIEKLLSIEAGVLADILTKTGDLNDTMAHISRDIIAKYLYRKLVNDVLGTINKKLASAGIQDTKKQSIEISDTFGFEDFSREITKGKKVYNSFPQLMHNCIQEEIVSNIFEHFKSEFENNEVIPTNILKHLLLAPKHKVYGNPEPGLFGLLQIEIEQNRAKLKSSEDVNISFKSTFDPAFIRTNKNMLEINHCTLMKTEKLPGVIYDLSDFIKQVLEDIPQNLYNTEEGAQNIWKKKTSVDHFVADYNALVTDYNTRNKYFIMCVKPCARPTIDFEFNVSYMSRQYCSTGLSCLFNLYTSGMKSLSHQGFLQLYKRLAPVSDEDDSVHCEMILQHLEIDESEYVIGLSNIFVSSACWGFLEETRSPNNNVVYQTTPKKSSAPVPVSPTERLTHTNFTKKNTMRKKNNDIGSLRGADNENGKAEKESEVAMSNNTNTNYTMLINQLNSQNPISNNLNYNYTINNNNSNNNTNENNNHPTPSAPTQATLYHRFDDVNGNVTKGETKEGDETTAAAATASRLAKLREKKQDRYQSLEEETKGEITVQETRKEEPKVLSNKNQNNETDKGENKKWKGKGKTEFTGDLWDLISKATVLQTYAIQDKKVIPGLSKAIATATELMESNHEGAAEQVPIILSPFLSEHGHRYLSDAGMLSLSQYLLSVKLDPAQEYPMYRLDRIISEILEPKQTYPTAEAAFEMTLLSSERIQRELYRIPIFFDQNSLLLTIRALTKVVNDNPRNVAIKAFLGFGLLESIVLLLVKTTTPNRLPLYADLFEKLSEFLFICSRHEFLTEYFRNNGGYAGLVVTMSNIIEVPANEIPPQMKNTLDIILKMLTGLENKYHGNLIKLAASQEGKIVSVHTVLLDILKCKALGEKIYLQVIELIKLISPVLAMAKPNEVPNALTVFFSAGHHVKFYKDIMNTNFLDLLTSPPTHSLTPPPPTNDWTPFVCCMIFHVLHFRENSTIHEVSACLQSFETLMALKRNSVLWDCLIGLMRSLDIDFARVADLHANHKIRELEKSNFISTWIAENTPALEKYCGKKLAKNEIDYTLYAY